jgi:hypothetical protein
MIDPKHLRLGNYIRYNEKFPDDPELELDNEGPLSEDDFNFMLIDNGDFRQNAEYIPLTEEWLKRFGFVSHNSFNFVKRYGKSKRNHFTIGVDFKVRIHDIKWVHVSTVHQLQNLYFAITEEELIITP